MQWIIEAGSSKTHSILLPGSIHSSMIESEGLNPVTDPNFQVKLEALCKKIDYTRIEQVHYYGSGCIDKRICNNVSDIIKSILVNATTDVQDDLLGAAKSTHGDQVGLIGILGTGSNFGYYDGRVIAEKISSCGYLLGDEGSGFRIGQAIYRRFARSQFTEALMELISSLYLIRADKAIGKLYTESNPRTYLASFAKIIHELPEENKREILNEVFGNFINRMVEPLARNHNQPVSLVGSIAFHFQDILKEKFEKSNIIAGSFVKSPIEGLIKYHEHG